MVLSAAEKDDNRDEGLSRLRASGRSEKEFAAAKSKGVTFMINISNWWDRLLAQVGNNGISGTCRRKMIKWQLKIELTCNEIFGHGGGEFNRYSSMTYDVAQKKTANANEPKLVFADCDR